MRILREILQTLLMALIIYAVIQSTVQTYRVYGSSMEPGLRDGQYLLINKVVYLRWGDSYLFRPPRPGEVVVLRPPNEPELVFIKRVVAVPGDTVEVNGGKVWVNGEPLPEPYIKEPPTYTLPPKTLPEGYYFVLGDNRNHSTDSHRWQEVGPIPAGNILGKAWLSFWPPGELGLVPQFSFLRER